MSAQKLPKEKLAFWKEKLDQEKKDALRIIKDVNEMMQEGVKVASSDVSKYSLHQADLASAMESKETQIYLLEKEQKRIKQINRALKRIYEESFGICQICGCEIPEIRLEIIPYARFCITCQQEEEANHRHKH